MAMRANAIRLRQNEREWERARDRPMLHTNT